MVSLDYLATLRALTHDPYDRGAIETNLRALLVAGLPAWTPGQDEILNRALPLIAEYAFLHGEIENTNWDNGTMLRSQGPYLDAFGIQRPPILRAGGETDEPYRLRLANSSAGLNIGSLASIEARGVAFNPAIVDIQAVTLTNRQDVNVYALTGGLVALTPIENAALLGYLNVRDGKIAGVDIMVPAVTQTPFTIDVTIRHTADVSPETLSADARAALYEWLTTVQRLGVPVYRSAVSKAAFVVLASDVTVTEPAADLPAVDGTAYTCLSDATNVLITLVTI